MSCYIISSKWSPGWYVCFHGRFNYTEAPTWPSGTFSPSKRGALADTGHIPLTRVRGRLPSLPWILTAGTLSNSEKRPLFPEALEQQWCVCEWVHQVSWVMNHRPPLPHSSFTHSLVMNQLQTIPPIKNDYQETIRPRLTLTPTKLLSLIFHLLFLSLCWDDMMVSVLLLEEKLMNKF